MAEKDWKAECERLRGELKACREQIERLERWQRDRIDRDFEAREEARKFFRDIVVDAIGR